MAEFQEVMRQINRMCWHYQRKRECPMGCPMNGVNISQCRKIAFEEPKETEKIVMSWAAEHPDAVYPTWLEWLENMGIVFYKPFSETEARATIFGPEAVKPIPSDIAEKLGLEPVNK